MNETSSRRAAQLGLAIAVTELLALAFLILFFTVGGLFGPLNDFLVGLGGLLSAALAFTLYPRHRAQSSTAAVVGLALALVGAVVVVVGSVLVIGKITGFVLAGWYSIVGYGLIGVWLVLLCLSLKDKGWLTRGSAVFGIVAGVVMIFGLLGLPGIWTAMDSPDYQPWYLLAGQAGWLGVSILYPIWGFSLWRFLTKARA